MNIEIHEPELEAMIRLRMASGRFERVEDVLLAAFKAEADATGPVKPAARKKSFTQFMRESPLWGSGVEFKRDRDLPRPVEL